MLTVTLPTYADVEAAASRIAGAAHRTPLLRSRKVNADFGLDVVFKAEHLQRAGAFKFRGAFNALSRFDPRQRAAGVVAYSSGNHAQAIALAARDLGIPATIVMPLDAPASKVAATRAYGAEVVPYDRYSEDREAIGRAIAGERGLTLIPPYDHPDVIAGQGTAAKELIEDAGPLDAILAPLGGGGLLAGTALSANALAPGARVFGVEPGAGNDGQQSFRSGRIVHIRTPRTLADGAQTLHLGELTFPIIQRHVTDILTVSDPELVDAVRILAATMKQVVEPTGALAFAGLRKIAGELAGKRVGVLISGGNIDLPRFASLVT
ncbi:MAG TPA: threo-3-hydroxy-L-aspartate ammonia-lyase [Thermomicrobiales bacterium]|nr:threo-3-hydroxy-L-aspartate ammonia-lyase [Thermomicrobiales bacterium]